MELSVIIPSRNEKYLNQTIKDVFKKSKGRVEIIAVLDGYWEKETVKEAIYIHRGEVRGMRSCVNDGVKIAKGKYILKCDAHCMFDEDFDEKLIKDAKPNWVLIPTRKRLDAPNWELVDDGRRDVNYMKLVDNRGRIDESRNNDVELDRDKIVETEAFQGSCWFMEKSYFNHLELEDDVNFAGSGHEAQEIYYKVLFDGGKCIRDKNTWYAHYHKPSRGFNIDTSKSRDYLKEFLNARKVQDNG